jgi:hypothetical protein
MTLTTVFVAVLPFALAAPAPEEKKAALPQTVPPRIANVAALDPAEGEIILHEVTQRVVPEVRKQIRTVNGKAVEIEMTVYVPVLEQRQRKLSLKEGKVFDTAGALMEAAEVWKRLKVGAAVLVSGDGKMVDPAYLGIVTKETVILAFPTGPDTIIPEPARPAPGTKP